MSELIPTGVTFGTGRKAINDSFSGSAEFNVLSATTIFSGSTDLSLLIGSGGGGFSGTTSPFTIDPVTSAINTISGSNVSSGNYSFVAGGKSNVASGHFSHAEGYQTTASGADAHAEGFGTIASAPKAHAEGTSTQALKDAAHAEGTSTIASGSASHAEGGSTSAITSFSHAEGQETVSSGIRGSHAEGWRTVASNESSHAEGSETLASGQYSHAEGKGTSATTQFSHSEGYNTLSSGFMSHSEGYNTTAEGNGSHAEGFFTKALGAHAHSEGYQTTASTVHTHAEGYKTLSNGNTSHAEGRESVANGAASHAEGYRTTTFGTYSHAEGERTLASGSRSHAEGWMTSATTNSAHSEGFNTLASGNRSHAEGYSTTASAYNSHAEGELTVAGGVNSHAGGYVSTTTGIDSFVHSSNSIIDLANGSAILGGSFNKLESSASNSVILGGSNITGTSANVVYTPSIDAKGVVMSAGTDLYNIFSTPKNNPLSYRFILRKINTALGGGDLVPSGEVHYYSGNTTLYFSYYDLDGSSNHRTAMSSLQLDPGLQIVVAEGQWDNVQLNVASGRARSTLEATSSFTIGNLNNMSVVMDWNGENLSSFSGDTTIDLALSTANEGSNQWFDSASFTTSTLGFKLDEYTVEMANSSQMDVTISSGVTLSNGLSCEFLQSDTGVVTLVAGDNVSIIGTTATTNPGDIIRLKRFDSFYTPGSLEKYVGSLFS